MEDESKSQDTFIKGTLQTDDYTSIKWILTGERLPDLPVQIIVNKAARQINWKEPYVLHGRQGVLSWNMDTIADIQLTK